MNKPAILFSAAASAVFPCLTATPVNGQPKEPVQRPAGDKPHIILIMTDQHRADALGCMGNGYIRTPNIDALAGEGTVFRNGYSSCPSSTPARAGLLTGMSPWHHGMLGYGQVAEYYKYEMPRMLREAGYYTFGIGKMHWHPQNALHGFHVTLLDESGRVESPYFISDYRKWFQLQSPGSDPDATGIGWNAHNSGVYRLDESLHPTAWTAKTAVELINNYESESPLFLKVSFARPHSPYDPPQRFYDMYKDAGVPGPFMGEWSEKFGGMQREPGDNLETAFGGFDPEYVKESRRHYYASITFIDEKIGEITGALKSKGMYDNAVICFVSDHGDMLGDHNHWRKTYAYEGSAAIPFIVKWHESMPRTIGKGQYIDNPVELRDVLPTFLAAAGETVPEDMDGRPLNALVQSENPVWRRWIDIEHNTTYAQDNYWCALTDGRLKYVWFFRTGQEQLFDLGKDPGETTDLTGDKKYSNRLGGLRKAMAEHLSERGEEWVKDGKLIVRDKNMLYSPHYPSPGK